MANEIILKTKRLILRPMPLKDLEQRALQMEAGEEREAYTEMLDGCRSHPENWLWYTPWSIVLKQNGTSVGDICFKGPQHNGTVEWGYALDEPYRGRGYMTEAARVLLEWAFSQKDVYAVEAETLPDNAASQAVLRKLNFKSTGTVGEEGPRFRREKQMAQMAVVYLSLGLCCGIAVGQSLGNMTIGMLLGMAVGFALGTVIDSGEKKHRQQVLEGQKEEKSA